MDSIIQEQIAALKQELQALAITPEQQKRLDEKFALEFNYNSNHIEGNTLTYTETKQLLQFDETTGNHTLREYEEMKASEKALEMVRELAADAERPLTETFIKNLNQVLLVRPYWKEALTPDGQPTRRKILVGDYKQQPNSVLLENGKMFDYASPAETPMMMHELIDWYRGEEVKGELQPIELAALLHYRFVCIHPFDDGNGRISRLLMNYVLYKKNLPPVIVKTDDKSNYRRALHDADSGNVESFVTYIAEQFFWSLELNIKAAKGESLEEGEDWKKKLNVLKKDLGRFEALKEIKSIDILLDLINNRIIQFLSKIFDELNDFSDLFLVSYVGVKYQDSTKSISFLTKEDIGFNYQNKYYTALCYYDFRNNGINGFNCFVNINFQFDKYNYYVVVENEKLLNKLYHQEFTQQNIEVISNECGKILLTRIEQQLNSSANA